MAGCSAVRFYRKHRDWKIRYFLGMNPLSLKLHSMVSPGGWLIRFMTGKADEETRIGNFFKEVLIQYNYLNGVKEELEGKGF